MIHFSQISTASIETLTDELAAAGWDSTQNDIREARSAVARLLNEVDDLRLYDSESGELITSTVDNDQAAESAQTPEGHILVDGRRCYVAN